MLAWLRRHRAARLGAAPAPTRPSPAVRLGLESLEQRENPSPWAGWANFAPFGHQNTGANHSAQAPSTGHGRGAGTQHNPWYEAGGTPGRTKQGPGSPHGPGTPGHGHGQTPPTVTTASLSGAVTSTTVGDGGTVTPEAGLRVELLDADGVLIAVATTAADGSYRFDGLTSGTYTLRLSAGETVTGSVGYIDGSGDGSADGATISGIEVGASQVGTSYNFALVLSPA